uniref:N-terminal EF-hand calcium binding protein 3 n=1 Tax=Sus scrofa TaxID=9823 RepID=A0A8D1RRK5_PIG
MGGRPPSPSPQVRGGSCVQSPEPQRNRSRAGGGAMACAGLLTVCLIRPPATEPPRPPAPAAGLAGHALFQDVFRRADKNDDGKLSFEEFQNYFADGVLSPRELRELFSSIDGHPTDNLETEKLCDYFSEHLGVYRPVLAALESLNCAVLAAMDTTKLEYERASKVDQFVTRFLLRETVSQLQALQSSLEGASDTLEAQARGPWSDEERAEVQSRPRGSRRAGRRALRSVGRSPTWSPGFSDTGRSSEAEMQWRLQINRLQELIDQLECKAPRLEPLHEEELPKGPNSVSLGEGQAAGCGARRRSRSEEVPGLAPAMASVLHTHLLQAWPSTGRHLLCDPAEICSSVNISVPHLKVLKAGSGTVWMKADSGSRKWYHSAVAGLRQLLGNEKRRMESGTWAGVRGWVGRSPTSGQLGLVQAKKARILLGATAVPRPLPCPIPADWAASLASTSSWPRGRCRWQRKPCRTSTMPCAAMWTSQGPRAIACMCLPRRRWTMPPSRCTSSGRMRPPGEGRSGGLTANVY